MKFLLLSFFLFVLSLQAAAVDLQAPEEISEALGLPQTRYTTQVRSLAEFQQVEAMNIFSEFPIVLVINKKASGPGAQRMKVYEYGKLVAEWKTSTGRERWETAKSGRTYFTGTPTGYYYPYELIRNGWSETWDAPMDFSVFFNGGVAVHATTSNHYSELGYRASGGCVRLHRNNASYIYERILQEGRGLVPIINQSGMVSRDRYGRPLRAVKWRTLIVVEDI
nr:L,D-transpeptidase [uncultured Bdellovibrio sp.]